MGHGGQRPIKSVTGVTGLALLTGSEQRKDLPWMAAAL